MEYFEVGCKVIIRKDLSPKKKYDYVNVAEPMLNYRGKEVTIARIRYRSLANPIYYIKEDDGWWVWSGPMFDTTESLFQNFIKELSNV